MNEKHLTQKDLSERWSIAEGTLQNWRSQGIGPVFLKIHNRIVYRLEDVLQYEADSSRRSTSLKAVTGSAA